LGQARDLLPALPSKVHTQVGALHRCFSWHHAYCTAAKRATNVLGTRQKRGGCERDHKGQRHARLGVPPQGSTRRGGDVEKATSSAHSSMRERVA
ncbi:hypothetical protein EE612_041317, partial [Oryza sativa]